MIYHNWEQAHKSKNLLSNQLRHTQGSYEWVEQAVIKSCKMYVNRLMFEKNNFAFKLTPRISQYPNVIGAMIATRECRVANCPFHKQRCAYYVVM